MSAPDWPLDVWASQRNTQGPSLGYDTQDVSLMSYDQTVSFPTEDVHGIDAVYLSEGAGVDPTAGWAAGTPDYYTNYSIDLNHRPIDLTPGQGPSWNNPTPGVFYYGPGQGSSTMDVVQPCIDTSGIPLVEETGAPNSAPPEPRSQDALLFNAILQSGSLADLQGLLGQVEQELARRENETGAPTVNPGIPGRVSRTAPGTMPAAAVNTPCPFDVSCDVVFPSLNREVLKQHYREQHDALEHTACRWRRGTRACGKQLKDLDGLLRHILQCHMKEKARRCFHCSKTFARPDSLTRHERRCKSRPAVVQPRVGSPDGQQTHLGGNHAIVMT